MVSSSCVVIIDKMCVWEGEGGIRGCWNERRGSCFLADVVLEYSSGCDPYKSTNKWTKLNTKCGQNPAICGILLHLLIQRKRSLPSALCWSYPTLGKSDETCAMWFCLLSAVTCSFNDLFRYFLQSLVFVCHCYWYNNFETK